MKPTIEQLNTPDQYQLVESIRIDEMNAFVQRELGLSTRKQAADRPPNRWFMVSIMVVLALVGGVGGYTIATMVMHGGGAGAVGGMFGQIVAGFVGFLVLLPIHEGIHGLSFRRVGAASVAYGGSLKSLMIYAYAQFFVMTLRELALVAAMPFLAITAVLSLAWLIWPAGGAAWGTVLLLHTLGCVGDFALIRYYYKNRRRSIYTYDDVEGERRLYFFEAVD